MPTTASRILRNGLLAAFMLGALGFAYAHFAGVWFDSKTGDREAPIGGAEVTEALQWRVPLTMAAWGFGLVALFELFASLWRKPETLSPSASAPVPDAEVLLSELLDQAEAAERERAKS